MHTNTSSQTTHLVRAAQDGDPDAITALYQRYSPLVFRTAMLLLGDHARAEDVTQDVFVHFSQRVSTYRPDRGAFTTWLHQITVHQCHRVYRRARLRVWLSLDRARTQGFDTHDSAPSPLQQLLRNEVHRQVWEAVQRLSFKLRTVVVLRYYHNCSYEEIAQVLHCPIGTVRSRLHAAHTQLQNDLTEVYDVSATD